MNFRSFRSLFVKRLFAWLALSAVLFGALAPTVGHAFSGKGNWLEICTVQGTRLLNLADESAGQPAKSGALQFEHCPFCVPNNASLGLPPAADLVLPMPVGLTAFYPERYFTALRPLFIWASANPRAPPVFSA